jgi:hypothetical protein
MYLFCGMKRLWAFTISAFLVGIIAIPAVAQEGESDEPVIVYDPLFWKSELKLKNSQCQSIQEINSEYYQLIESTVRNSDVPPPELKEIAKEGLVERSQKIWDTLHPIQKRKWVKLWQNQYTAP